MVTQVTLGSQSYFDYINHYQINLYYLINDERPDYIIRYGSFFNYHESSSNIGDIGYEIRPVERNKDYGAMLLKLLLLECEKIGMHEVCVSCLKENLTSSKVIKNNKGKLEKEFFDEDTCKYGLKYWVKLHSKIAVSTKRLIKIIYQDI